jgi:hypothetical protein
VFRPLSKHDAQRRVDQIAAFRAELQALADEGLTPFDDARAGEVAAHHERLLRDLTREFDVDRAAAGKQMSLGMRIASLLGAAALVAAVVSFVNRIWGTLPEAGQVALLTAAPIVATVAMVVAGRIEKTRYVASLLAIVACAAVVLQTVMLGRLFNLKGSPHVLAVWALFALAVSVPWRFGVSYAFGLLMAVIYPAALAFWVGGVPWEYVVQRPEPAAVCAGVVLAWAGLKAGPSEGRREPGPFTHAGAGLQTGLPRELVVWTRSTLLLVILGSVLVMSATGAYSLLPLSDSLVQGLYQVVAVAAAAVTLHVGLRRGLSDVVALGSVFAGLFLLLRFVDWWWDWMPKYLFFLILAAVALAWLWGLRVARRRLLIT